MRFTKDHEWIRIEGDHAVVGITSYAQQQLGDVVFIELPDVGKTLEQGKEVEGAKRRMMLEAEQWTKAFMGR